MLRCFLVTTTALLASSSGWAAEQSDSPPATPAQAEKSPPERAWDDLRWLMTALEAYAVDNDSLYAPIGGPRDGVVSDLDQQLEWYYQHTYPKRSSPPHVDPWGRPYLFVISGAGKHYALYSLGPKGKLDAAEEAFLERVRKDQLDGVSSDTPESSQGVIVGSGMLRFAPAEVLKLLRPLS
jgi:hypothetical protein